LIEKLDGGPAGAAEFERLMHQLLGAHGARRSFAFEPMVGKMRGAGFDGIVRAGGVPGFDGPVAFELRCVRDHLRRAELERALERAARPGTIEHWVLVTPRELTPSEQTMLSALEKKSTLRIHHWGPRAIEPLLRAVPALLARYFPDAARPLLDGYEGFDFRAFAAQYRAKIALLHGGLRTLGLPPEALARERESRGEIRLRDIFVPLRFTADDGAASPETLAHLLDGRSVVVLGDPGTGKSTLLSFIALLHAGGATIDGFEVSPRTVPLSIPLRDFARLSQARPGLSFLDYLEERARTDLALPQAHRAFFESALRMGEAVILFDGLDEVGSAAARRTMRDAIRAFHADYPACPVWVTSRIYGYTADTRLPAEDFAALRIGRLDDGQIDDFIARWYRILAPHNERERVEQESALREAVHRTPSVRRLATTPLLLTLMAFLHQGMRKLPQDRGELYEKCVEMLLKTWQEAKRPPGGEAELHPFEKLGLYLHTQKDYLAHLALAMQSQSAAQGEEARGMISRGQALECLAARHLERSRREHPGMILAEAREEMSHFLDYISDRTGLLLDRGGELLSFIHLSFQEYLAAWVYTCLPATQEGPAAFFRQHLGDPVWEEVLLLRFYIVLRTPGGGGPDAFDMIVAVLLKALERADSPAGWLTLARAVRDNLEFSKQERKVILEKALGIWLEAPKGSGAWFNVLEEIVLFADKAREALRELVEEAWRKGAPERVVAALHLATRLFGFPGDAAIWFRKRDDLAVMLPDLVWFGEEATMAALLAERASFADWNAAFAGVGSLASRELTLSWACQGTGSTPASLVQAAVGRMVRSVVDDLRSRSGDADGQIDPHLATLEVEHEIPGALLCPALARERGAQFPVATEHFDASFARYWEKRHISERSELRDDEQRVLPLVLVSIDVPGTTWIESSGVSPVWDEFVAPVPSLSGPQGALALLHGANVVFTSRGTLEGPVWTKLLADRDQADPLIAFTFALHELCHRRDQQTHSAKLNALLADPPDALLPILQAAGLLSFDTTSSSPDDASDFPLRDSAPPAPGEPARPLFAWIHLSDLDFGGGSAGHEWDRTLVLDEIRKDLSRRSALQIPTPRAIFLTGDIAWSGQPEEYTAAKSWLLDLASSIQLGPGSIFAVPGNHDVDLSSDKNKNLARLVRDLRDGDEPLDEALADPDDRAMLARRQQHYLAFTADIAPACLHAPAEPQSRLSWSHRLTARQSLRVRLAGLNTSLLAGRDLPKGKLWLGKEALAQAFVEPPLADDELVIVLSHHTLREGWLGDEQDASRWIKSQAHIHLAGHVHEADQEQARRGSGGGLVRIVAGAAHADAPMRGAAPDHGYNLAAVYPAEEGGLVLRVWARRWSDKNKEFRTDDDDVVPGQAYAEYPLEAVRYEYAGAESLGPVSRAPATARRP
jgi:3',5'-cyclic AMP phosphodiesterase CpdA